MWGGAVDLKIRILSFLLLLLITSCAKAPRQESAEDGSPSHRLAILRQQSMERWRKEADIKLKGQPDPVRRAIGVAFEAGYDQALRGFALKVPKRSGLWVKQNAFGSGGSGSRLRTLCESSLFSLSLSMDLWCSQ